MRLSLALVLTLPCVFAQGDPKIFDYDATTAFDYKETLLKTRDGVSIHDATFLSPKGGYVPC